MNATGSPWRDSSQALLFMAEIVDGPKQGPHNDGANGSHAILDPPTASPAGVPKVGIWAVEIRCVNRASLMGGRRRG